MDLPDAPPGRAADTSAVSAGGLPGNDALVSKKSDSAKHTCKAETPEGTPFWLDHTGATMFEDPPAAGSGGRDTAEREAVRAGKHPGKHSPIPHPQALSKPASSQLPFSPLLTPIRRVQ